jgi:microsomal dipeptidase-like Zn-dependent dipeptidase
MDLINHNARPTAGSRSQSVNPSDSLRFSEGLKAAVRRRTILIGGAAAAGITFIGAGGTLRAQTELASLGGRYAGIVNALRGPELAGLVDMHTHPAAHLGFGTELFYGAPDGDPGSTMNNCNPFHGGWGLFDNQGGNEFRRIVVDEMRDVDGWDHKRNGWPDFPAWPSWHDRLHQQMRIEWLERAWRGGLRVVVALAVNNHTLADGAETQGPYDDKTAGDNQIRALTELADRHDFLEVVKTPWELRSVVAQGRLAMVLGVELDAIGNFYQPMKVNDGLQGAPYNPQPSEEDVRAEIRRLHELGVRYFFLVHINDNVFGGAALYMKDFEISNRFATGSGYSIEQAPESSGIGFQWSDEGGFDLFEAIGSSLTLGVDFTGIGEGRIGALHSRTGYRNSRGLQPLGGVALSELMRLGALIDIDHASEKTVESVLAIARARSYPLCAGHNGVRSPGGTERQHTEQTLRAIYELNGLLGVGIASGIAPMAATLRHIRSVVPNAIVALGSDASGLEHLPGPRFPGQVGLSAAQRAAAGMVVYRDSPGAPPDALIACHTGNRTWDYSIEGCAHVGLFPDMIEEIVSSGLLADDEVRTLFRSAERFVRTWEACHEHASG